MEIIARLEEELKEHGLDQEIAVVKTGCFGLCAMGPIMVVYPEQVFYCMVTPDDVPEIVEEHLVKGRPVQRLIYDRYAVHGRGDGSSGGYRLLPQAETDRLT